jgi:hypothetical protein
MGMMILGASTADPEPVTRGSKLFQQALSRANSTVIEINDRGYANAR